MISGKVVHGKQVARTMGFPTANIEHIFDSDVSGIYCGTLDSMNSILYINNNLIEVHVLDWSGDLYDKIVEICIEQKLREHITFECLDQIISQIKRDITICRLLKSITDSIVPDDRICIAYSGGKEACILVDLLSRCHVRFDVIHFKPVQSVNEESNFFDSFLQTYNKTYTTISYEKNQFQSAVKSIDSKYTICFLGVRSSDTGKDIYESTWLSTCKVLVPLFHMDYNQVWYIIEYFDIQVSKKYSEGYSSIGYGSLPNKFLKKMNGLGYIHAKYLENINTERS
jgi:3'-phosphoadenosine 5'-phosphosulfate sulfotransferase (PAPS reductase)/FAD synthetase